MKTPALQNKQVVLLRMAFRARKVIGTFEKRAPGDDLRYTSDENKAQRVGLLGALFVLGTKDHCISSVHGQVIGLSERPTPLQSILDPIYLGKSLLGKCYFRDPN